MTNQHTVTEEKLQKIKERLEKLMSLAEHPNTPEAERESAKGRIEKLMAQYSITEAAVSFQNKQATTERTIYTMEYTHTPGYIHEKSALLTQIARALGVESIGNLKYSRQGRQVRSESGTLIGTYDRMMLTWDLYVSLVDQMERECAVKVGSNVRSKKSFMTGFAVQVHERIETYYAEAASEMDEEMVKGAELVMISDSERIQQVILDEIGPVTTSASRKSIDYRSYSAGIEAGNNADIAVGNKVGENAKRALV